MLRLTWSENMKVWEWAHRTEYQPLVYIHYQHILVNQYLRTLLLLLLGNAPLFWLPFWLVVILLLASSSLLLPLALVSKGVESQHATPTLHHLSHGFKDAFFVTIHFSKSPYLCQVDGLAVTKGNYLVKCKY